MNLINRPTLGQSPRLPTTDAIETAIRNGDKMHGKYTVTETGTGDLFIVQNIVDPARVYGVTTIPGLERCGCKQFKTYGTCKHQYFVSEYLAIKAGEARAEALAEEGITCYR